MPRPISPLHPTATRILILFGCATSLGEAVTWDKSAGTNWWSEPTNWDTDVEPNAASTVVFPAGLGGTIALDVGEQAQALQFADNYILAAGGLALAAGSTLDVSPGATAVILTPLSASSSFTKTGGGVLVLQGANTIPGAKLISEGTVRVENAGALGSPSGVTTVQTGANLVLAHVGTMGPSLNLMQGSTISGNGKSWGSLNIDSAATAVTMRTYGVADVLSLGANLGVTHSGGSTSTVVNIAGPGTVSIETESSYDGSWIIPEGRLLASSKALGDQAGESITLAGGTFTGSHTYLSNGVNTYTSGPGNHVIVTANSSIEAGGTVQGSSEIHIFGSLEIGSQTLTVANAAGTNGGKAGIVFGSAVLGGDPVFVVNETFTNAGLTLRGIQGGALPRTITKTGNGTLSFGDGTGTTSLAAGSTVLASGGDVELVFPDLGPAAVIAVSTAQHPLGNATLALQNTKLKLLANGANDSSVQTFQVPAPTLMGGATGLEAGPRTNTSGYYKTFEFPGLTLAADTSLEIAGGSGMRVAGPLILQGNANLVGKGGGLSLNGGIQGGAGAALNIGPGGTSGLALSLGAASSYGGGTQVSGTNVTVTVNASGALGSGPLQQSSGNVSLNASNALGGNITLQGGTLSLAAPNITTGSVLVQGGKLELRDPQALAGSSLSMSGGQLSFLSNTSAALALPPLGLSGNVTLFAGNNGTAATSFQTLEFPALQVNGDTTLTLGNDAYFTAKLGSIVLAGNLTLASATTITGFSEDGVPRSLTTRSGFDSLPLRLTGPSAHSGGTYIEKGYLQVEHSQALGTGPVYLGPPSGNDSTTLAFKGSGLVFENPLVIRAGGTGNPPALMVPSGGEAITWNGPVDLQRDLTIAGMSGSVLNGVLSGSGKLYIDGGGLKLTNPANSFGGGSANAVRIEDGTLTITSDAALGPAGNGVILVDEGGNASLQIDGSFSSSRSFQFNDTDGFYKGIGVTEGNEFTLNSPLTGNGRFTKVGPGVMSFAPGVNSNPRGTGTTQVREGTLRVLAPENIGTANPVRLIGGTLELSRDADTDWGYPLTATTSSGIRVAPAPGSSALNGRHTIPSLSGDFINNPTVNVTATNGYGLNIGSVTGSLVLNNNSSAPLIIGSGSQVSISFGGSGDIQITGPISGSGWFTKDGTNTLRTDASITGFSSLRAYGGILDLNGHGVTTDSLGFGGSATPAQASQLVAGAGGGITLANYITTGGGTAGPATYTGPLALTAAAHTFGVYGSSQAAVELDLDGPITGETGATVTKDGTGVLRYSGSSSNTFPGLTTVSYGTLELNKSSGDAIGTGGLSMTAPASGTTGTVKLLANDQINDTAQVMLNSGNDVTLDLNNFTEAVGNLLVAQTDHNDASIIRTGANGTLVLKGSLTFDNATNGTGTNGRDVLLTGTGNDSLSSNTGTLDLDGGTRTVSVNGTHANAGATIETRVVNGKLIKTGSKTLYLTNPQNSFTSLQINDGMVRGSGGTSLGTGSFVIGGGNLDFNGTSSPYSGNITVNGLSGNTLSFSGAIPQTFVLSGTINAQRNFTVDVTNGSTGKDRTATLDITGTISDGANIVAITKNGEGTLRLAAGNTYSGATTITKGTVSIAADSALGDTNAAISMRGGCLMGTAPMTIARPLTFNSSGGSLRSEAAAGVEIAGNVTWSTGATASFGSGTMILSGGSTTGTASLSLGMPTAFASSTGVLASELGSGHVLSLRGNTLLPTGNLSFDRGAVLELGNGDFTRALGTAASQFQMPTSIGGGWAAYGADRTVNVGGASATLLWGQASPAFLNKSGVVGALYLGSSTATHTLTLANPLQLHNGTGASGQLCKLFVNDGPAALDAKLAGSLTVTDPLKSGVLEINGTGTLEIAGENNGAITVIQKGTGTTRFSSERFATMSLEQGKWLFLDGPGSALTPVQSLTIGAPGELDVSGSVDGLGMSGSGELKVYGTIKGSISGPALTEGNGFIDGAVSQPAGILKPVTGGALHISGALNLGADLKWSGLGPAAGSQYPQLKVDGGVTLSGVNQFDSGDSTGFAAGQSYVVILNGSPNPIAGTFENRPEGTLIHIAGGPLALKLSYQMNGDGQATGNDFGFTVIDTTASDRTLALAGPVAVGFGEEIALTYTLGNAGPAAVTGARFEGIVPAGATFLGSTPAGTLSGEILTIPLADMPAGGNATVLMRFQAGNQQGGLATGGSFKGTTADPDGSDPVANRVIAILPGGADGTLPLSGFSQTATGDGVGLSLATIAGVKYRVEGSADLTTWETVEEFTGNGEVITRALPVDERKEFFRVVIVE